MHVLFGRCTTSSPAQKSTGGNSTLRAFGALCTGIYAAVVVKWDPGRGQCTWEFSTKTTPKSTPIYSDPDDKDSQKGTPNSKNIT